MQKKGSRVRPFAEDARRVRRARLPLRPTQRASPAHLRMGGAVTQLLLVVLHVFAYKYVLKPWNKVNNKNDMVLHSLHRPVRRRTV